MQRVVGILGLLFLVSGCVPAEMQQRIRDYNDDGVQLYQRGDYRSASESFQAALALDAKNVGLLYNLGECYDRLGDGKKAEHYYHECLQKSPQHEACRFSLASLMVRQGRADEAVQMTEGWLAREPKLASAYALDGWLWHQTGDLPRAQARLQQALEFNPQNVRALTELGQVYEKMQRQDRAAALYERALIVQPNQPEVAHRVNRLRAQGVSVPRPD